MAEVTVTKGLIGLEDISRGVGTFSRATSTGGTQTMTKGSLLVNVYNVIDYGATADGVTDDSGAIQDALDAANAASGGTVYVPPGTYSLEGTLYIDSNVTLWMDPSAIMLRNFAGVGQRTIANRAWATLVYPRDGTINETDTNITIIGGDFRAASSAKTGGHFIFSDVGNLRMIGVKATSWWQDWCVGAIGNDMTFSGLFLDNTAANNNSAVNTNDDGLHVSGGKRVVINDCWIRAGDDALAVASSVIAADEGTLTYFDIENVTVSNCFLQSLHSRCIDIGLNDEDAEATQAVQAIAVSNCTLLKDYNSGWGIVIEDARGATSSVADVSIANVTILGESSGRPGVWLNNVSRVSLSQVRIIGGAFKGPGFYLQSSTDISLLDCYAAGPDANNFPLFGTACTGIKIYGGGYGDPNNTHATQFNTCDNIRLRDVEIFGVATGLTGAYFNGSTHIVIDGCRFVKAAAATPSGCIVFGGVADYVHLTNIDYADCSATLRSGATVPSNLFSLHNFMA